MTDPQQTTPGRIYRKTRPNPGCYFTRPKRVTPSQFVNRLTIKGDPLAGYWSQFLKANPDAVLMKHHHRGTDLMGKKWENTRYVLLSKDERLREVKTRPGYGGAK